ncbi:MAG: DUF742 domain-containing protein [Microthrixaceae bacterium]
MSDEAACAEEDLAERVRPYARTAGRTRPALDVGVETLIKTTDRGRALREQLSVDERRIIDLAYGPLSVAEVSAHMGVVLSVVRILVADLVVGGAVEMFASSITGTTTSDRSLLEKVLLGLEEL